MVILSWLRNMKVYVLCEEVDIIGVYSTRESAEAAAKKYELFNYYIDEKKLEN
jgi:hypothetical protein